MVRLHAVHENTDCHVAARVGRVHAGSGFTGPSRASHVDRSVWLQRLGVRVRTRRRAADDRQPGGCSAGSAAAAERSRRPAREKRSRRT